MEVQRLLSVLDQHLGKDNREYIMGKEFTIADMAIYPWVLCLDYGYKAKEFLELNKYKNVMAWCERIGKRPAVERGMKVLKP